MSDTPYLLKSPISFFGTVVHGRGLGARNGFPTANLDVSAEIPLPKDGVYAGKCLVDGREYVCVINIGHNPTISDSNPRTFEIHILDFSGDIYGHELTVKIIAFLRNETIFSSMTALSQRIAEDIAFARNLIV